MREERAQVQKAVLRLGCLPIGMELFPSANDDAWGYIKGEIENCDYYVIIVGGKYGSIAPDGIRFTEKEYRYAGELRKPCLVFVRSSKQAVAEDKREQDDDKRKKLNAFVSELNGTRLAQRFETLDDLGSAAYYSLNEARKRTPILGYVRVGVAKREAEAEARTEFDDLMVRHLKLQADSDYLGSQNASLQNDLNKLRRDYEEASRQSLQLSASLKRCNEEAGQLATQNASLKAKLEASTAQWTTENTALKRQVAQLGSPLSALPKPPDPPIALYRDPTFGRARFRRPNDPIGVHISALTKLTGQGQRQRITLKDGPATWLQVAPEHRISKPLKVTDIENCIIKLAALPLYGGGGQSLSVRNNDGFGLCALFSNQSAVSVVYVFTDGEIWAIDTFSLQSSPDVIPLDESLFVSSLQQCANFLLELNINGPYRWMAGFEGVNARFIYRPNDPMGRKAGPCMSDAIEGEGTFRTGDDPALMLEPFFADIYDQCGLRRPTQQTGRS